MTAPTNEEKPSDRPSKSDEKPGKVQMSDIDCPHCGKSSRFNLTEIPKHFPFCSMRCKSHDLGEWLTEDEDEDDEDDAAEQS